MVDALTTLLADELPQARRNAGAMPRFSEIPNGVAVQVEHVGRKKDAGFRLYSPFRFPPFDQLSQIASEYQSWCLVF